MTAVFADTFYWIAVTNVQDLAHERVKAFTRSAKPDVLVTTEEVPTLSRQGFVNRSADR